MKLNPKLQAHPTPDTRNSKPYTRNPQLGTLTPTPHNNYLRRNEAPPPLSARPPLFPHSPSPDFRLLFLPLFLSARPKMSLGNQPPTMLTGGGGSQHHQPPLPPPPPASIGAKSCARRSTFSSKSARCMLADSRLAAYCPFLIAIRRWLGRRRSSLSASSAAPALLHTQDTRNAHAMHTQCYTRCTLRTVGKMPCILHVSAAPFLLYTHDSSAVSLAQDPPRRILLLTSTHV